jgi:DNA-directed RNA polymerase specialized sigma24 family protein
MVIFVFDIEKCVKRLDRFSQDLVAKIVLQEYSQGEAADLMGQSIRSIGRKYVEAIDTLTAILLEYKLLDLE